MASPLNYKVSLYIHILGLVKLRYVFIRLFKWIEGESFWFYTAAAMCFFSKKTIKKSSRVAIPISVQNSYIDRYIKSGVYNKLSNFNLSKTI